MNRRHVLLASASLFLALSTVAARADEISDIIGWLRGLGFDQIGTTRSLLGRIQIRASGPPGMRELVVNPRTGEILRDVWVNAEGKVLPSTPYVRDADSEGEHDGGDASQQGGGEGGDDGGGDQHGGDDGGGDGSGDGGDDGGDGEDGGGGSDDGNSGHD